MFTKERDKMEVTVWPCIERNVDYSLLIALNINSFILFSQI